MGLIGKAKVGGKNHTSLSYTVLIGYYDYLGTNHKDIISDN